MKTKKDDLNKIVQDLSVKLYQQAQEQQGNADADAAGGSDDKANGNKGDGNTFDGDFSEVDDDKK